MFHIRNIFLKTTISFAYELRMWKILYLQTYTEKLDPFHLGIGKFTEIRVLKFDRKDRVFEPMCFNIILRALLFIIL